ncbi:Coenzyme F420 hydrogenase/dehydrogenase, beta subunit C-terminal domain [Clostridium perfringens]
MIKIVKKSECHGCHGCKNICPKNCISMKIDEEGFWYPEVNEELCIKCNLCEKVCPIINKIDKKSIKPIAYACKNKNENSRLNSSSGGVFELLCRYVIENDGVVFGASFDNDFNVRHNYAESINDCYKFRGSKYVQSIIGDTYKQARDFLKKGRVVLFSGTPCQIAGLDKYLMKEYDNLIMVDIACHGVPSPLVYKKYINKIKKYSKYSIIDIKFRDKSTGWKDYNFKVSFEKGEFVEKRYKNKYMEGFLQDLYLRPSCYECEFKKPITSADITLADYWGVENIHNDFDDDKGISLILIHTKKGKDIKDKISLYMDSIETKYDYAIKCNPSIITPVLYNKKKEEFFNDINEKDIEKVIKSYTKAKFIDKVKRKVKWILEK